MEDYIETHPDFIQPEARKNEMLNNFIKPGLQDLCFSRTSFKWGIPVEFDSNHVVYVWLDALTNYITNIGYDIDEVSDQFKKLWPADLQVIGKDIVRFHSIYWPCFLWSLNLPLPKKIFGHPLLLMNNDKMSKSKGNVIYADELVNLFGVDAVRYYLLHEIPFSSDGNITYDLLIYHINGELANVLGNLVQRSISMGNKYFDGVVKSSEEVEEIDFELENKLKDLEQLVDNKMEMLQISEAITEIFNVLRFTNKYIDETTPWVLAKDANKSKRLQNVIYHLLEAIRVCSLYLEPFMPGTSNEIRNQLNISYVVPSYNASNEYHLNTPSVLFQRIDRDKFFEEHVK